MCRVIANLAEISGKIEQIPAGKLDDEAIVVFGALRKAISQVHDLPYGASEEFLGELTDQRAVLKFLCDVARERRMYAKQVKATLDMLLRYETWQRIWQQNIDLLASLPDDMRQTYVALQEKADAELAKCYVNRLIARRIQVHPAFAAAAEAVSVIEVTDSQDGDQADDDSSHCLTEIQKEKQLRLPIESKRSCPAAVDTPFEDPHSALPGVARERKRDRVMSCFVRSFMCIR